MELLHALPPAGDATPRRGLSVNHGSSARLSNTVDTINVIGTTIEYNKERCCNHNINKGVTRTNIALKMVCLTSLIKNNCCDEY